jgi:hypothetical protein
MVRGRLFHALKWLLVGDSLPDRHVVLPKHNPVIMVPAEYAEQYHQFLATSVEQLGERYGLVELRGRRYRQLRKKLKWIAPQATAARIEPLHAYRVTQDGCSCNWITLTFPETVRERSTSFEMDAIRQAVMIDSPVELGEVLIRPERIADLVCELFENRDIDFEDHPVFSRRYFVQSPDEAHLRTHLPRSFRDVLANRDGLILRARGNRVLLARDRKLEVEDASLLVEVALQLLSDR